MVQLNYRPIKSRLGVEDTAVFAAAFLIFGRFLPQTAFSDHTKCWKEIFSMEVSHFFRT